MAEETALDDITAESAKSAEKSCNKLVAGFLKQYPRERSGF